MSALEAKEKRQFSLEEKLESTYTRLKTTSIFFCMGWVFIGIFIIGIYNINNFLGMLGFVIGWIIIAIPMINRMWTGGFKKAFKLPEYEVFTTNEDGSKKSDGGFESRSLNLIIALAMAFIMIFIGGALTIFYMLFLKIKYTVLYIKIKPKLSFLRSGFLIMIFNIVVFLGVLAIGAGIQNSFNTQMNNNVSNELLEQTVSAVVST